MISHRIPAASLLLLWTAAFVVRLARLLLAPDAAGLAFIEDSETYWRLAAGFLETGRFLVEFSPGQFDAASERMPGYTLFLALFQAAFGESLWPILITQGALDSLSVVMIACLASRFGPRTGLIAGALAALWPNFIIHSNQILTDSLFVLFITWFLLACVRSFERPTAGRLATAALALGLATGVRAVTWPFLLAAPLAVFLVLMRIERGPRRAAAMALLFLATSLAPIAPWLVRNHIAFGDIGPTSQGGSYLSGWVTPEVMAHANGTSRSLETQQLRAQIAEDFARTHGEPLSAQSRYRIMKVYERGALEALLQQPIGSIAAVWAKGMLVNLAAPAIMLDPAMRRAAPPIGAGGLVHRLTGALSAAPPLYTGALAAGLVGALLLSLLQAGGGLLSLRLYPGTTLLAGLFILYFLLVNGPIVSPKYRLPMEPVLIVWAALALDRLRGLRRPTNRPDA